MIDADDVREGAPHSRMRSRRSRRGPAIVQTIGKASAKKLRKVIRKANDDAKTTMGRKGVQIVTSPPEMIAEFTKASSEVQKELAGKVYSKEELDMVLKHRDEFRAKNKK